MRPPSPNTVTQPSWLCGRRASCLSNPERNGARRGQLQRLRSRWNGRSVISAPMRFSVGFTAYLAITSVISAAAAATSTPTAEQIEFFEGRIRPILAQECYECHSTTTKQKGDLVLDSRAGWQKG